MNNYYFAPPPTRPSNTTQRLTHPKMALASEGAAPSSPIQFAKGGDDTQGMTLLPEDFAPTIDDVVCGRGSRRCFSHCVNKCFHGGVAGYLAQYSQASSKLEKSVILSGIVAS
jgi:hypothetical protein